MATNPALTRQASRGHDDPVVTSLVTRARNGDRQAWDALAAGTIPDDHAQAAEQDLLAAERYAALREAFGQLPPGCQQLLAPLTDDPA